jgi:hypothetical protein
MAEDKPVDTSKVEKDARFNFGPPLIQTPEDATQAYLRGEISEDELRAAHAKFGVVPGSIPRVRNAEPIDAAYQNQLPDDLYVPEPAEDTVEKRMKAADDKQKDRDEKAKEAGKQPTLVGGTAYAENKELKK